MCLSSPPNLCPFALHLQNKPVKFLECAHDCSGKLGITFIRLLKGHSYKISFWNLAWHGDFVWEWFVGIYAEDTKAFSY